jgi:glycosyltransferase involved in cell wall biosynthesis
MATIRQCSARQAAPEIWVVAPFTNFTYAAEGGRYAYVAAQASRAGAAVTFFTSGFDHYTKRRKPRPAWTGIRFVRVYEPGYRSNVSLRRICSHLIFDACLLGAGLWVALTRGRPRSILCPLPHNGGALLLGLLGKLLGSRFVVDVHDTWPESLLAVHRVRAYQQPFYRLWRWCADAALRLGDAVFAESLRYAERADRVRLPRGQSAATCVYLGGDIDYYGTAGNTCRLPPEVERAPFRAAYVGSLGRNYDLDTVVQAFRQLQDCHPGAYLIFLGGGELESSLRRRVAELGVNAWFSGLLPHHELVGLLRQTDYGLNTFAAGGNVAYSYKLNDYLLAGVPVINSLSGEMWDAVEQWDLGYNYPAGDVAALAGALGRACAARERAERQRQQVRTFAANHLDRRRIYEPMLDALLAEPTSY